LIAADGSSFRLVETAYSCLCRGNTNNRFLDDFKCRKLANGAIVTNNPYQLTFIAITKFPQDIAAEVGSESRSVKTEDKKALFPCSVTTPNSCPGHISHLVSAAWTPANSFFYVPNLLFGYKPDRPVLEIRRLLNGSQSKKRPATGTGQKRREHTGIKHMISNMIRLPGQSEYFDVKPCFLILPILSLEEAKNWKGKSYEALILIDKWDGTNLADVCSLTCFAAASANEASNREVTKAVTLLRQFVKGIGYAIQKKKPEGICFDYENIASLRLPSEQQYAERKPVNKVTFTDQNSSTGHPAPDPMLLSCKSAAVWAKRNGWILAASKKDDDDSFTWNSMYECEAEKVLAARRKRAREEFNPIGIEIECTALSQS